MLPGHWRMSEADIEQMNDMRKGGIGVSQIHDFMASLAVGYHNVPYTTREMHNVNAKQRREGGLDAESCLRYLRECKINDPALYYKEVVDETYVWLLQQLQISMKGKAPVSIITDDDRQMKSAIEQVFPEAHHRLCAWYILRKWFEMVEKFGIADKRWVQDMYERRHSWATAHIREKFFAEFRTTSRCEGLHAVISRYVKSRYSYTEFLRHFHRCLMFVRAKEVEADFECAKSDPVMTINLKQLERSAAENYTRAIFYLFVPILDRACAIRVVDSEDNGSYFIYTVSRYGTPGKDWRVVATSDTREVRCTCMRMECFGVPYEHIIAVLVLNNVHEILRSLILPRWTKDAKLVAVQSMGVIWDSVQLTQHWCLMDWYRKVCKIACHSTEKFQFARDITMLMLKHFKNEDAGDTSFPPEGPPTEGGRGPARNPPRRNTKGNGAHGGKKT
ncbi:hypothetical protein Ahy_B04g070726 isoform A [Arachis hypogaea]|uniref:SWIM-type domain-containing protein n=1 Tax=Arachis hypogaea TaxID=3818 RepID=A0A444ZIM5_ARAHY|nr:hypothetical protein Ahy_B04g070726 isoform A [Arachis hypogaea]